ncbi:MAG: hypothetical protein QM530_07865 [Phycisphaerales bacterium]|nr:hypothetical protein [Phycisphaerales bacterium]
MTSQTITTDNETEFALHKQIAKMMNTHLYLAYPQSPHQRGANVNPIGLNRQYMTRKSRPERLLK